MSQLLVASAIVSLVLGITRLLPPKIAALLLGCMGFLGLAFVSSGSKKPAVVTIIVGAILVLYLMIATIQTWLTAQE